MPDVSVSYAPNTTVAAAVTGTTVPATVVQTTVAVTVPASGQISAMVLQPAVAVSVVSGQISATVLQPAVSVAVSPGTGGVGVPAGGSTSQVLAKTGPGDFQVGWVSAGTPAAHETTHLPGGSDALPWTTIHGYGILAARPAAASTNAGYTYYATDNTTFYRSNGTSWDTLTSGGGGAVSSVSGSNGITVNPTTGATIVSPTYGTTANTVTQGNDGRLSDTRTPTAGSVVDASITAGGLSPSKITGTAVVTSDSRLSDPRTPTGAASGDLTGTYPGPSVAAGAVTLAKLANLAANSIIGNNTGSPSTPAALTASQVKALLAIGTGDVAGLAAVASSGSAADLSTGTLPAGRMPALTGAVTTTAGTVATLLAAGVVGVANLSATGTPSAATYLRGDNTWATVSGSSVRGSTYINEILNYR